VPRTAWKLFNNSKTVEVQIITKDPIRSEKTYSPSIYRKDLTEKWKNAIRSFSFSTAEPEVSYAAVVRRGGTEPLASMQT
jgi:hypothetical protein